MFKKIVLITILIVFVFSQNPHGHDQLSKKGQSGGFKVVDQQSLLQLQQKENFKIAEKKIRDYYFQQTKQDLGQILKIQTQVVAGINYRVTFESTSGPVVITIFCQPWTNTYQIIGMVVNPIQSN